MEPKIVGISRKVWNILRVAIYMIKKGLCKRKLLMDLNMMIKRGKIARKALGRNLMFHHNHDEFASQVGLATPSSNNPNGYAPREYEFSCSNTPLYRHYFTNKRKNQRHQNNDHYYMPSPFPLKGGENVNLEDVSNMLDMILRNEIVTGGISAAASPALPGLGFRQSLAVRQLRITDSPFPVRNDQDYKHVDQAAEDFIKNFYSQLKQQK